MSERRARHRTSSTTTADGAAGIWGPYLLDETPEDQQQYAHHTYAQSVLSFNCNDLFSSRWAKETHDFIEELWNHPDGGAKGISLVSSTRLNLKDAPPIWHDIVYGFRKMSDKEVGRFGRDQGQHRS